MRLLQTTNWTFHNHRPGEVYCILSHRWNDDDEQEIHYGDARSGNWKQGSAGYDKISGACRVARSMGYEWIWIDTCCINKDSDSELSEAINSMYLWYAEADVCLAYLVDVPATTRGDRLEPFRRSSWFTRGWTLQELLAPRDVQFFDTSYTFIGSKITLSKDIERVTGIPGPYLANSSMIKIACIAEVMSWASTRQTKRKEDMSYCLLGLLGINMPLLYGERDKAFLRLQKELLAQTNDQSIFAWGLTDQTMCGMLASSPKCFAQSGVVRRSQALSRLSFSWTPRGVLVQGEDDIRPINGTEALLRLNCRLLSDDVCIRLRCINHIWYRTECIVKPFDDQLSILQIFKLSLGIPPATHRYHVVQPGDSGLRQTKQDSDAVLQSMYEVYKHKRSTISQQQRIALAWFSTLILLVVYFLFKGLDYVPPGRLWTFIPAALYLWASMAAWLDTPGLNDFDRVEALRHQLYSVSSLPP